MPATIASTLAAVAPVPIRRRGTSRKGTVGAVASGVMATTLRPGGVLPLTGDCATAENAQRPEPLDAPPHAGASRDGGA
ncbi:hypothetical protein GCM10023200_06580 [Actinomycetospora chlora]|uniref:Uncharacterized protein n=1 Tax=Actinomycetospora chlora TaxID=663608 RepID=A0ABP9AA71_9PSEU